VSIRKALTLDRRLNLLGLLSGPLLAYVTLSDKPWWILIGGAPENPAILIQLSPFAINMMAFGKPVQIPIITYLCLGTRLSLLVAAAMIVVGSIAARKTWSRHLMSLAGFTTPIMLIILIYIGIELLKAKLGISIPIIGETIVNHALSYSGKTINIQIPLSTKITYEYWIALAVGALTLIAKLVHTIQPHPK